MENRSSTAWPISNRLPGISWESIQGIDCAMSCNESIVLRRVQTRTKPRGVFPFCTILRWTDERLSCYPLHRRATSYRPLHTYFRVIQSLILFKDSDARVWVTFRNIQRHRTRKERCHRPTSRILCPAQCS